MLRNRNLLPPGGFPFTEERTGLKFNEQSWSLLIDKIISHREHKELLPVDRLEVEAEVEKYYEKILPEHYLR